MSADPVPDQPVTPEITALFERYAEAWSTGDADAILAAHAWPHVIVTGDKREFIESEDASRVGVDAALAQYAEKGVARMVVDRIGLLPLPDDAARVAVLWRFLDADGAERLKFPSTYTLRKDEDWHIIAIDAQGEADAWAGAGWA